MRTGPAKLALLLGALIGLILVVGLAAGVYLTSHAKPRIEAMASDMLGLDVKIAGRVRVNLLPTLHLTLTDVHLHARTVELITADEVELGMQLGAALHRQARIDRIAFKHAQLYLQRGRDGKLDLSSSDSGDPNTPEVEIAAGSAADTAVLYKDLRGGKGFEARGCDFSLRRIHMRSGAKADWLRNLSFDGEGECKHFTLLELPATDLKLTARLEQGRLKVEPIAVKLFGGHGEGTLESDYTQHQPLYRLRYELRSFRLEDLFRTLTDKSIGKGVLNFATNLSMHGLTIEQLRRTASGTAVLRGENLTLEMGDLDKKFSHFEATQNFTLVDAAAFLFAGPIGLGISKGYDYSQILQNNAGSTPIPVLVSQWQIEAGVAHASDVAMATAQHRLAMHGSLNFVTDQIEDSVVALVDAQGCTQASQKVHGPFKKPELEPPTVAKALTAPTRRLMRKAATLLGHKCVPFYTGSVPPPRCDGPCKAGA